MLSKIFEINVLEAIMSIAQYSKVEMMMIEFVIIS
jgi:hypothetical protein